MTMRWLAFFARYGFVLLPPAFFLLTVCTTIGFGDTALLVNDMQRVNFGSHVNNHPLTVLTGALFSVLFPLDEIALRANLVSVFYGSLTVIVFYGLLLDEFKSVRSAVLGALLLMICHSLWWHSTIVENYAASAFLTTLCLYCWRRHERTGGEKWLLALCFCAGLGVFNHVQMSFVCAGVLVTAILSGLRERRLVRVLLHCAPAALAGLLPWLLLLARDASRSGSLSATVKDAFVGKFSGTFFGGDFTGSLYDTAYLFWFQSPTLYLSAFGAGGMVLALRARPASAALWGMLTALALNLVTFCFYPTWDKFAFMLQSFVILHFFASSALHAALQAAGENRARRSALHGYVALCLLLPPYLYAHIAAWGRDPASAWSARYNNNYSDNAYFQSEFIVNPNKRGFDEVDRFAKLLFARLPAEATFLDDDSRSYYPLAEYFQKYYGLRPDVSVLLVNSWGMSGWGLSSDSLADTLARAYALDKPFYAISDQWPIADFIRQARHQVPELKFAKFPLDRQRWVYRLVTRSESAGGAGGTGLPLVRALNFTTSAGDFDLRPQDIAYAGGANAIVQDMNAFAGHWRGADQLFFHNERPGGSVEFQLRSEAARRVDLVLGFTAAPDFARVQIEVLPGGTQATADLYGSAVQPMPVRLPGVHLGSGINVLKMTVLEKNPKSSGYHFGLDGIEFVTTQP